MIELIQKKFREYRATNPVEEEHAVKEIIQEIALYALWRGDFFNVALFQGGTSLRILHRLPRFSEDLDFMLRSPNPEFDWTPYLKILVEVFAQFGLKLDAQPRERMDSPVREAVLKNDSIASQLDLTFAGTGQRRTIKIKLEIDTNPPPQSGEASTFLDFPADHEVRHQDLPSNFALLSTKAHSNPLLRGAVLTGQFLILSDLSSCRQPQVRHPGEIRVFHDEFLQFVLSVRSREKSRKA